MSQVQPKSQKTIAGLILCVFFLQVIGCGNLMSNHSIDVRFDEVIEELKIEANRAEVLWANERLQWANTVKNLSKKIFTQVNSYPKLSGQLSSDPEKATQFVIQNQPLLQAWFDSIEMYSTQMRELIYFVSKKSYESTQDSEIAHNYVVLYFALNYLQNLYRSLVEASAPLALGASMEELQTIPEVQNFKKIILDHQFACLGMTVVIENDIANTLSVLTPYKKSGVLPAKMANSVERLQKRLISTLSDKRSSIEKAVAQLSLEDKTNLDQKVAEFRKGYEGKTLLYTPGMNSSAIVNFLTVIGNLTWGLINTVLGIGVIVFAMIVSPFIETVDFPSFSVAQNGKQIAVEIDGLVPWNRNFSLGLLEFRGRSYGLDSKHEGAHATQSAVLGPLYLPVVMASYVLSGGYSHDSLIERWADAWK